MKRSSFFLLLLLAMCVLVAATPDEGMYPISDILKLDLRSRV